MEEWRDVIGYEDVYHVSNLGRLKRVGRVQGRKPGLILQPVTSYDGYKKLTLSGKGKRKNFRVNRLVCSAFHGAPADGQVAHHKNGERTDNRAVNLEWITRGGNQLHGYQMNGRISVKGEAHGSAKLTEKQVKQIRGLHKLALSHTDLAHYFDVSRRTIRDIVMRKRWNHI